MPYRHTQKGTFSVAICLLSGTCGALLLGRAGYHSAAMALLVAESIVAVLFSSLTVVVGAGELRWYFGPGLWRTKVPLTAIQEIAVVRNSWWHGLGLRLPAGVKLYSVSGLDAVELRLAADDIRRIGTDDPHGLAMAIRAACARARRPDDYCA